MNLYTVADSCDFGNLKDVMIRDCIIVGIRDRALSEQLQMESDLTLEKVGETARGSPWTLEYVH